MVCRQAEHAPTASRSIHTAGFLHGLRVGRAIRATPTPGWYNWPKRQSHVYALGPGIVALTQP